MWSPRPSLRQLLPVCDDPEFLREVLPVRARVWVSPFCRPLVRHGHRVFSFLSFFLCTNKTKPKENTKIYPVPCGSEAKLQWPHFPPKQPVALKTPSQGHKRAAKQNVKRFCSSQRRDCPLAGISGCLFKNRAAFTVSHLLQRRWYRTVLSS